MATRPNTSDLVAALALLDGPQAATDARASAREALGRKCPRFVPSSEPILPFMSPLYWARRMVENVPHTEILGADGEVIGFSAGGLRASASLAKVA